ncbi:MAG TPA: type IX secretion system outer membrane channel protein PorV [Bacteroidia bacterium]|nr:type IX secretion system outer membrane channel protein PorV [Bacteroidia bacterium]
MKFSNSYKILATLVSIPLAANHSIAQSSNVLGQSLANNVNVVTTAVPFLLIGPDARAGGMGDAGVATTPDANSLGWNPAKLAFIDGDMGFSISYTPWLRQLVPDINLGYLSFYKKMKANQALGVAMRYFSLGNIDFTDANGNSIGSFTPAEYSLDVGYSLKLNENWGVGMAARYIYSNLTGAVNVGGEYTKPGRSLGVDISAFYKSKDLEWGGKKTTVSGGICISNMGPKIAYTQSGNADFLPTQLRLGPSITMNLDEFNKITWALDITKLLVPTPPVYKTDATGSPVILPNGQFALAAGDNPNVSVPQGMIQSFYDAPGGGLEEFHEINYATGFEYWYDNQFAARTGFFYESPTKGGRQYITFGAGFRLKVLNVDLSYLIPITQQNPLQNTLRLTLGFKFEKNKKGEGETNPEPAN